MRKIISAIGISLAAASILLSVSCAPKPATVPEASTYELKAATGDTYLFQILPADPNEFKDAVGARTSRKIVTFELKLEHKPAALPYEEEDFYCGNDREASKTTLYAGDYESFSDLGSFLVSLPPDKDMRSLGIAKDSGSIRVKEEKRNVTIDRVYIYAIKHEPDSDYHIIIGDKDGENFFNIEITGLPEEDQQDFNKLLAVRNAVKTFFDQRVKLSDKYNKPNPPIPIKVSGSLFYDIDHAPGIVGPAGMRPATAWEIHPVSNIEFFKR